MPTEKAVVNRILKALRSIPECKAIKFHGSPYVQAGTPDICGAYRGRMFAIEVKANGNQPTPIQRQRLREWHQAGVKVAVAYEDFDVPSFLAK